MITKIITSGSNANGSAYTQLFEDASRVLKLDEADYITTLNEYFHNLPDLLSTENYKPKFVRLPVDEDFFEIDANTRKIKVPASFAAGASVQGDQGAETIFFIIDRYFDAMDLNNQEIYIEWSNSVESGLSPAFAKDIESQPDKIIFGWLLEDVITQAAGQVEFAVRFYSTKKNDLNEDVLSYSLSTLPQKITINKALNFELLGNNYQVLNPDDLFFSRIVASEIDNNVSAVSDPVILLNITADNLNAVILDSVTGEAAFDVQAYSPDGGAISYVLQTYDNGLKTYADGESLGYVYKSTTDTVRQEHNTYYIEIQSDSPTLPAYEIFEGELPTDGSVTIYEKFAVCVVDKIGKYRVKVLNRRGATRAFTVTNEFTVPAPQRPVIDIGRHPYILDGEKVTLELKTVETMPTIVTDGGDLSYQWYLLKDGVAEKIEGATSTSYDVTQENFYQLIVSNTLNKATEHSEAAEYRVTYPTEAPKFTQSRHDDTLSVGSSLSVNLLSEQFKSDVVYITWYQDKADIDIVVKEKAQFNESGVDTFTPEAAGAYYAVLENVRNLHSATAQTEKWTIIDY